MLCGQNTSGQNTSGVGPCLTLLVNLSTGEGTLCSLLTNCSVEIDCGLAMALAKDIALGLQVNTRSMCHRKRVDDL